MPHWLLGIILGILTAGLDYTSAARASLSNSEILILSAGRILIGLIIGSNVFAGLPRNYRWIRGVVISLILSIPLAIIIPNYWQAILGFGIAYGAIIGYLIDRILPFDHELHHHESEN
jgi:membrane glycosyltransferase